MKKSFSENNDKSRLISSKKPLKQPIPWAKHANNIRISLKFTIEPEEQRGEYVQILNRMIMQMEGIINSTQTKTSQRLRAMQILTKLVQTSYTIVRDVDIEALEREIDEAEKETEDKASQ
jgi:hypothetical protein